MMKKRKLGIIGGSGLYKMDGFEKPKWKKVNTPWGKPSDEILIAKLNKEELCFIPRHSRGHKINPSNNASYSWDGCRYKSSIWMNFTAHGRFVSIPYNSELIKFAILPKKIPIGATIETISK